MVNIRNKQLGFTLVEIAIVLVIIGLIVGGVLVGQDMIRAAEIRATVGQVEKYKTSMSTFQSKYSCLPGDCLQSDRFGFQTRTHADGHGDGDGRFENCPPGASQSTAGCENVLLWRDLSDASMIEGSFTAATDAWANAITASTLSSWFPMAKLGKNNVFVVLNSGAAPASMFIPYTNYFYLGSLSGTIGLGQPNPTLPNITPAQAYNIDIKLDDGRPQSGSVIGGTDNAASFLAVGNIAVTVCASAADRYNLAPAYAHTYICVMNIKM